MQVLSSCLGVCVVVVSSRKSASVSATVEGLRAKGIKCTGRPCHVGSAEDRTALLAHAKKVLRFAACGLCREYVTPPYLHSVTGGRLHQYVRRFCGTCACRSLFIFRGWCYILKFGCQGKGCMHAGLQSNRRSDPQRGRESHYGASPAGTPGRAIQDPGGKHQGGVAAGI